MQCRYFMNFFPCISYISSLCLHINLLPRQSAPKYGKEIIGNFIQCYDFDFIFNYLFEALLSYYFATTLMHSCVL